MTRWLGAVLSAALLAGCSSNGGSGSLPRTVGPTNPPTGAGSTPQPGPTSRVPTGPLRLEQVAKGLGQPVYVTAPQGDGRLFIVDKAGRVRVRLGDAVLATPYLDLTGQVSNGGEQGLLSIAFSPDYRRDGRVYADYTDRQGDTRVVEFRVDPANRDRVDPRTRREILRVPQPFANPNGGLLLFDPSGMLLVGLGDGGSAGDPGNRAQDLGELLGKVLRIDPRHGSPYSIPTDNPFVHRAGARPEIWLSGLRNPWRFSFDPASALWIGDVGQNHVEEIDAVAAGQQAGRDFGWRVREGDRPYSPGSLDRARLAEPVAVYEHDHDRCSVTGGVVAFGRYLYGDYCSGEVWTLRDDPHSPGRSVRAPFSVESLVSFGVDGIGRVYAVSGSGGIWRIVTE